MPNSDSILDSINFHQGNLLDEQNTHALIKEINPDYILENFE